MNLNLSSVVLNPEPATPRTARYLLTQIGSSNDYLLVIDNSSLECFTTCPTVAFHKLVLRREAQARNAALVFGGSIHAGLEAYLLGESPAVQTRQIVNYFTDNPVPTAATDDHRTIGNAIAIMDAYRVRDTMPDYAWTLASDSDGPLVERPFELPLGTITINADVKMPWLGDGAERRVNNVCVAWSGRIDAVAHYTGALRVIDHKTTSIAGDQFIQDFQISNQTLGYVWAARHLWPDLGVSGFCLNAIHFKKPTGSGPITEPGPRGGSAALNFFRACFDYSDTRLAEWEENCLMIVEDFLHCLVRNAFPMHTKWCFGKYGPCQYHNVCTIDDRETRYRLLMSDAYKPVTWDPVAGR